MSLTNFNSFAIPGSIDIVEGQGKLPLIKVTNSFAEADIYLHGAHITRFDPKGEKGLLWMSDTSPFAQGKAIRGGIPICFPWFGAHRTNKDLPMHGFVRTRSWKLIETAQLSDGRSKVRLQTVSDEESLKLWPHEFTLSMAFTIGTALEIALTATNSGYEPLSYEDCFHTYFNISDLSKTLVSGLDGVGYIDKRKGDIRAVQSGDLRVQGDTVHLHVKAPSTSEVTDTPWARRIRIDQQGMDETVVWNPGEAGSTSNPEMAGQWSNFLCVESANCADDHITLLPGTSHTSQARYSIEKL
ncbi:D-hexose-6-phosphate mutarotase [Treponema sp.]